MMDNSVKIDCVQFSEELYAYLVYHSFKRTRKLNEEEFKSITIRLLEYGGDQNAIYFTDFRRLAADHFACYFARKLENIAATEKIDFLFRMVPCMIWIESFFSIPVLAAVRSKLNPEMETSSFLEAMLKNLVFIRSNISQFSEKYSLFLKTIVSNLFSDNDTVRRGIFLKFLRTFKDQEVVEIYWKINLFSKREEDIVHFLGMSDPEITRILLKCFCADMDGLEQFKRIIDRIIQLPPETGLRILSDIYRVFLDTGLMNSSLLSRILYGVHRIIEEGDQKSVVASIGNQNIFIISLISSALGGIARPQFRNVLASEIIKSINSIIKKWVPSEGSTGALPSDRAAEMLASAFKSALFSTEDSAQSEHAVKWILSDIEKSLHPRLQYGDRSDTAAEGRAVLFIRFTNSLNRKLSRYSNMRGNVQFGTECTRRLSGMYPRIAV